MANLDAPNGLLPVRHLRGGIVRYSGGYTIDSGEASSIFQGDGIILHATPGVNGNNIDVAAAGGGLLGVFAGCQYVAANGDVVWSNQWVGGTVTSGAQPAEAFVYTDPDIVFSIQVNGALANTEIGGFADLDVSVAGNAATGVSGMQLNATVGAGPAQLQVLSLAEAPGGIYTADISTDNPRVLVQLTETPYRADNS